MSAVNKTPNTRKRKASSPVDSLAEDVNEAAPPNESKEKNAAEIENQVARLCIFQCLNCMRIVGDDKSFTGKKPTLSGVAHIALRSATNVKVSDRSDLKDCGIDGDSVFAWVRCECGSKIGRFYFATPMDLDELRDCYILDISKLYCYTYGENYVEESNRGASTLVTEQRRLRERQAMMQGAILSLQKDLNTAIKYYGDIEEHLRNMRGPPAQKRRGRGRPRLNRDRQRRQ